MGDHWDLADVIDETIEALVRLDTKRLQDIEARVQVFAEGQDAPGGIEVHQILAKKRVLEGVLRSGEEALDSLHRLNGRNEGAQWER
jgi:hypothetical protein